MSVAPHSGIVDFGTFTPPTVSVDGIQGEVPKPLAGQAAYILTANGWAPDSSLGTVTSVAATGGTGISVTGSPITTSGTLNITNTAPDKTVALTGAGTTSITGTYPNFTITSNDSATGTVTSVSATVPSIFSISGSPITTSGTLAMTYSGTALPAANGGTGVANNAAMTVTGSGNFAYTRTLTATTNVTFPTTGTLATLAGTETLTNKRTDPRVTSAASATTLTPSIATADVYAYTALAAGLTINAPTGTPLDGDKLIFRLLDNGTSRALTWNATYTVIGVTLPTATTISKTSYVGCIYNANNTRWDVIAVTTQA